MALRLVAAARRIMVRRDVGATSLEYALIAALIAAVVVTGVAILGVATTDNFGTVRL